MKNQATQEITSRIKEAGKIVFSGWGATRKFCLKYGINYYAFLKTLNENSNEGQKRHFDLATVSCMVIEFGVSADWILTGRGSMFQA